MTWTLRFFFSVVLSGNNERVCICNWVFLIPRALANTTEIWTMHHAIRYIDAYLWYRLAFINGTAFISRTHVICLLHKLSVESRTASIRGTNQYTNSHNYCFSVADDQWENVTNSPYSGHVKRGIPDIQLHGKVCGSTRLKITEFECQHAKQPFYTFEIWTE